jgi:predicted dehydrogenase
MSGKRKVRVGIIGAGGISQVAHIPNLVSEPGAEVAAVSDIDPARAAMVAKRFEIAKWYDEPEQMLRREKLDAVLIATPTISHLPLCQMALESGVDVMVEKPLARNCVEARTIVEVADLRGRQVMVAMNHRFREDAAQLKQMVARGELGDIVMVRSGWLKPIGVWGRPYWFTDPKLAGGGVLMDLGLQMIDLVMFVLGFAPVLDAVGTISHKVLDLQVEDAATAHIRFADEATLLMEVSWANIHQRDVAYTVFSGSQGSASLNPLKLVRRTRNRIMEIAVPGLGDEISLYRRSYKAEIAHFINCIGSRSSCSSSGREAVAVMEVVERIYRSAGRQGG